MYTVLTALSDDGADRVSESELGSNIVNRPHSARSAFRLTCTALLVCLLKMYYHSVVPTTVQYLNNIRVHGSALSIHLHALLQKQILSSSGAIRVWLAHDTATDSA